MKTNKILRIVKTRDFLQKAGWVALVLGLIFILVMMVIVISKTEPNVTPADSTTSDSTAAITESLDDVVNSSQLASLVSVRDMDEFALATRLYEEDVFVLEIVMASGPPAEGKFYEAWLEGDETISIGALEKDQSDEDVYTLNFNAEEDLSNLNKVVITEESLLAAPDDVQDTVILEGLFGQ